MVFKAIGLLCITVAQTSCSTCETTLCYGSNVRSTLNAMLSSTQMQEERSTDISLTKIVGTRSNGSGWTLAKANDGVVIGVPKQDLIYNAKPGLRDSTLEDIRYAGVSGSQFGYRMITVTTDTQHYLIVTAPNQSKSTLNHHEGAVHIYDLLEDTTADPMITISGVNDFSHLGVELTLCGDLDGDSVNDWLVSEQDGNAAFTGKVWIGLSSLWLPSQETTQMSIDAFPSISGTDIGQAMGSGQSCLHDLSGNGTPEVVLSSPFGTADASAFIAAYEAPYSEPRLTWSLQTEDAWLGEKVITAMLPNNNHPALVAVSTPSSGDKELRIWPETSTENSFSIPAPEDSVGFGKSLIGADLDGDTWTDIIVGAPFTDKPFRLSGRIYIYLGHSFLERRETGNFTPDLIISNPSSGAMIGDRIDVVDYNNDQLVDIITHAVRP